VLTGPTTWAGGSFTLLSAIYYVNVPATSATHTLTIHLSNPAPLVVHVFAASGWTSPGPRSTPALAAGSYTGHFQYVVALAARSIATASSFQNGRK
jgi:hypothetical protein